MADAFISGLDEAEPLDGTELLEVSQLSPTVTITAATISAQASDNSFNDSGSGFVAAGFAVDQRVRVQGFTGDVANNLFVGTITALTTSKMTIGGTDGDAIVDDAAGESVTITAWETKRTTAQDIADLAAPGSGSLYGEFAFNGPMLADLATAVTASTASVTTAEDANKGFGLRVVAGASGRAAGRFDGTPGAPFTASFRVDGFVGVPVPTEMGIGIALRNSSNGRMLFIYRNAADGVTYVQTWSDINTFNGALITGPGSSLLPRPSYMAITVTGGGTVEFWVSANGLIWESLGTTTLATYIEASGGTADQIGVVVFTQASAGREASVFCPFYRVEATTSPSIA